MTVRAKNRIEYETEIVGLHLRQIQIECLEHSQTINPEFDIDYGSMRYTTWASLPVAKPSAGVGEMLYHVAILLEDDGGISVVLRHQNGISID